jgi:TRAP-type C4-dicarboxylate transport system substrate-binding protein
MTRSLLILASATILLPGCGGGSDKAGGDAKVKRHQLTLAYVSSPPSQVDRFRTEVDHLSNGALGITYRENWRAGRPDFEVATIHDVAAGRVAMAVVGARAFDRVGVTSFQPLLAPLLVDSYALERKVFEAGIPRKMLAGVAKAGVVGVAVLPGPMRKLLGITRSFAGPADFSGQAIGLQDSDLASATLKALGATAHPVPAAAQLDGLDGYEQQLDSIASNEYDTGALSVTADLNLWPRPLVLVMNRAAYAALTDTQRAVFERAATAAIVPAVEAARNEDREAMTVMCNRSAAFEHADVSALRRSLAGVVALDGALAEITRLKAALGAPAEAPACKGGTQSAAARVTPVDGVYEFTTTKDDLRRAGFRDLVLENYGHHRWTLHDGRFRFDQDNGPTCDTWTTGTYAVDGRTLTFRVEHAGGRAPHGTGTESWLATPGEVWTYRWSLYRDTLTLAREPGAVSPEPYLAKPWRKLT